VTSEQRLDELRNTAATATTPPAITYYDLPLLKAPVWTWEIPLYFFVGGAAGTAAILGLVAQVTGGNAQLVKDARRIAFVGAVVSAPLLISDLGRPERFLNMLRIFKPQSPMSVGAWTVALFGGAATGALLPGVAGNVSAVAAAGTGAVMATYTGVLLGATVVPAWNTHVALLPIHFGASSLGSAVSLLELRGHRHSALQSLALGAAIFECLAMVAIETGEDRATAPLRENRLTRIGALLSGPIPLVMRLFGGKSKQARRVAAAATLAGSLLTRFAWVEAGKKSAKDVGIALR
jgi:formate-dependent nitrite reductase membrane component NrfD